MFSFHVGVATTVSSALSIFSLFLVKTNVISLALSCTFPPSIHIFVPLTLVSGFTGTSSVESLPGTLGIITVAVFIIVFSSTTSDSTTV